METSLLEELKQKLEELKKSILEDGIPKEINMSDDKIKEVKEHFNDTLDNESNVKSVVYAIDGELALTGTTAAVQGNLLCLVLAAIDKGVFKDEESFYNELKEFKDLF